MRLGSMAEYWPSTRNGRSGSSPIASWWAWRLSSSRSRPTCTVPASPTGSASPGIGPSRAPATLTLPPAPASRLREEVRVQRVAGQQQRAAGAGELLGARSSHRQYAEAQERQYARGTEPAGQARRRPQRRELGQQHVEEPVADPLPAAIQR